MKKPFLYFDFMLAVACKSGFYRLFFIALFNGLHALFQNDLFAWFSKFVALSLGTFKAQLFSFEKTQL